MRQGGGSKGVERHLKQGKLLVKDRLSKLLDNVDDFLELSSIAGLGMPYGDVPAAGVITGMHNLTKYWWFRLFDFTWYIIV